MGLTSNRIGHEGAPVRKEFDGIKSKEPGMSEIISVLSIQLAASKILYLHLPSGHQFHTRCLWPKLTVGHH